MDNRENQQVGNTNNPRGELPSRRSFLKGLGFMMGAAGAAHLGIIIGRNRDAVGNTLAIIGREASTNPEKSFTPESSTEMLPISTSERIFTELELDQKYSETLNLESFHLIAQRVWRLANLNYQDNDPTQTRDVQVEKFEQHCKEYLRQTMEVCDQMDMDLVACMLLLQVSGANTSSAHAIKDDIRDERVRSGLSLIETLYDQSAAPTMGGILRELGLVPYYSLARAEGRLTLGTHDIEVSMISRSLLAIKEHHPEIYTRFESELNQSAPGFMSQIDSYVEICDEYEASSHEVTEEVRNNNELKTYLSKYQNHDYLFALLTTDGRVDDYQFLRTTAYWAEVSKLQALTAVSGYSTNSKEVERQAIEPTINFYLKNRGPEAIFLDNCSNPKFISMLERDARRGSDQASKLLEMANRTKELSDRLITEDRQIGAALIRERTEFDEKFQIITGVAYARWMLTNARTHQGLPLDNLKYSDPDKLAYDCFLGTAHRETGASYQLAGTRPLQRASLPFEGVDSQLDEMDRFIKDVYIPTTENRHPREDFKSFLIKFADLVESSYLPSMFQIDRFKLTGDKKTADFVTAARKFGADQTIITPPHCSWQRAMEATIAYIAST